MKKHVINSVVVLMTVCIMLYLLFPWKKEVEPKALVFYGEKLIDSDLRIVLGAVTYMYKHNLSVPHSSKDIDLSVKVYYWNEERPAQKIKVSELSEIIILTHTIEKLRNEGVKNITSIDSLFKYPIACYDTGENFFRVIYIPKTGFLTRSDIEEYQNHTKSNVDLDSKSDLRKLEKYIQANNIKTTKGFPCPTGVPVQGLIDELKLKVETAKPEKKMNDEIDINSAAKGEIEK